MSILGLDVGSVAISAVLMKGRDSFVSPIREDIPAARMTPAGFFVIFFVIFGFLPFIGSK